MAAPRAAFSAPRAAAARPAVAAPMTAAAWPLAGTLARSKITAAMAATTKRRAAVSDAGPLLQRDHRRRPIVRARAASPGPAATRNTSGSGSTSSSAASANTTAAAAATTTTTATATPATEQQAAAVASTTTDDQQNQTPWQALLSKVASPRFRALAMLNAMTLLLGTNWVVLKAAATAGSGPAVVDPQTFTAMRFALATAAFSPWLLKGFRDPLVTRAGAEMGAWCAGGYVAQAVALSMTPASRASLLSTFTVLIVPVFAALKGRKIKPFVWLCAGAAVAGTLLLEAGSADPPNLGDAWAILSAAAFAGQLFRTEVLTRGLPPSSSLPLMAVSMAVIAAMTAAVAGVADWRDAASTADAIGNMAGGVADVLSAGHPLGAPHEAGLLAAGELFFTALLSTALALLLELIALKDVSSTEAALVYSLEPLVGASLSCLFLGERFGPTGVAGAAIILVSSLATQIGGGGGGGHGGGDEGEEEQEVSA